MSNDLWVDKYRPTKISDMVLSQSTRTYFENMVKNNSLINCTFIGTQGQGKTTLARALANEFNATVLFVNCAVEGNVATAQGKLKDFCDAMSLDGSIKIVILDELDSASATQDSSFQKSLRNIIESAQADTRFICTANYPKIIPAVLSRCPVVSLAFDKKDLLLRLKTILDSEKIEYTKDDLKAFINFSFKYYPDCRRIISYMQSCCSTGKLVVDTAMVANDDDYRLFVESLVKVISTETNPLNIRRFVIQNKSRFNDNYLELASSVFNSVVDTGKANSRHILQAADIIYKMNVVVDVELQMFALCVCLHESLK